MKPKYCSIDLEFTGFDPEKEQILEIGFAFFDIGQKGLEVGETWSQVFHPSVPVHQKILGLTGISQEEINGAPDISEFRDFLSDKLGDAILVAHNPTLDVKFLEAAGVKLSGQTIDTLELVQFLLPTHHSYNLENLMHYFGISHKESHRALADCLATISLLEKMIAIHAGFNDDLKQQLRIVMVKTGLLWTELLKLDYQTSTVQVNDSLIHGEFAEDSLAEFNNSVVIDPDHYLHESRVLNTLKNQEGKWLLVINNKAEVLRLWQAGNAEGIFQSKDLFARDAFEKFAKQAETSEELRFILKILVWLNTNWQTKTILDLNLSFFGGQFKNYITGGEFQGSEEQILICDYKTFSNLSEENLATDRKVVICDLQRFENYLTSGSREKLSWYYFSYLLKSIYNPETEFGQSKFKTEVVDALTAVDLFFGLVQLLLRQNLKQLDYISLSDLESLYGVFYNRISQAAENLTAKLTSLGVLTGNSALQEIGDNLTGFFKLEQNFVKWIELSEENVVLHSQPIEIKDVAKNLLDKYQSVTFTDTLLQPNLLFYFAERLGLDTEILKSINNYANLTTEVRDININDPGSDIRSIAATASPVVMLFGSNSTVKTFYKDQFEKLGQEFRLLAQEYSGSGNKIFRNFRIFPNALLLATSQFINKQKYQAASGSVVYLDWPEIDERHPYTMALLATYSPVIENFAEILVFGDFVANMKQLSGQQLPKIYLSSSASARAGKVFSSQ